MPGKSGGRNAGRRMVVRLESAQAQARRCHQPLEWPSVERNVGSMKPTLARIADLWCRLMHKESIWPSHGYYECRTCGRRYRVSWEQASPATPHELALSCETRREVPS